MSATNCTLDNAQLRDEVERLRAIVNSQKADGGWHAHRRRLMAEIRTLRFTLSQVAKERDAANRALRRLRDKHYSIDGGSSCDECGWRWPCEIVQIIEGER